MDVSNFSLINLKSACDYLKAKESHVRSLVFKKQIPVYRIGRLLRFKIKDLEDWIETKKERGM